MDLHEYGLRIREETSRAKLAHTEEIGGERLTGPLFS
jgi:hypothetical protein